MTNEEIDLRILKETFEESFERFKFDYESLIEYYEGIILEKDKEIITLKKLD